MKKIVGVLILICFTLLLSFWFQDTKLDEEQTLLFKKELGLYLDGAIKVSETGESNEQIQYKVPVTHAFTKLSAEDQQQHLDSLRDTFSKQQIHNTNEKRKLTEIRLHRDNLLEKATYIVYLD